MTFPPGEGNFRTTDAASTLTSGTMGQALWDLGDSFSVSHHVDGSNVNEKSEDYEHPGDRQPCFFKEHSNEICLQVSFEIKISSFQILVPPTMELANQPVALPRFRPKRA